LHLLEGARNAPTEKQWKNAASIKRVVHGQGFQAMGECPTFCVSLIWSILPERSKDNDDFKRTAGRVAEGLQAT
jgi:hypothetical protein